VTVGTGRPQFAANTGCFDAVATIRRAGVKVSGVARLIA
jgi:hypothetical protein